MQKFKVKEESKKLNQQRVASQEIAMTTNVVSNVSRESAFLSADVPDNSSLIKLEIPDTVVLTSDQDTEINALSKENYTYTKIDDEVSMEFKVGNFPKPSKMCDQLKFTDKVTGSMKYIDNVSLYAIFFNCFFW